MGKEKMSLGKTIALFPFALIFYMAMLAWSLAWYSWSASVILDWFAVPLGFVSLSTVQIMGIAVAIKCILRNPSSVHEESKLALQRMALSPVGAIAMIVLAYIIKGFL